MSKEDFLTILNRQQASGLSIKDFCENESYPVSSFCYWKSKYGLTCSSGPKASVGKFAPVSFRPKRILDEGYHEGTITIEFPSGVKIHFRDTSESGTAMQVITQLCHRHVLPE
jgi:putative transposase